MGGSGGYLDGRDLRALEQMAREALKVAPVTKRNVFISFAIEDLGEVNLFRAQAQKEDSTLEFNDWSLKEPFDSVNAEYIKRGIRERIKQSSITICYVTENTANSRWVDWEIRESYKLGKKVVAIYKGDKPPRKLPPAVQELKVKTIPWNHEEINRAIDSISK
jgi:hypothetical protein